MKSFAVSFFGSSLVLVLCTFAFVAYAQTSTTTQAEREALLRQERASSTQQRQENQEARRAAFSAQVETRVAARLENVQARIEASIARMRNIIGRIETRMGRIDADTTQAQQHLADAKESLILAENAMDNVELGIADLLASENPRGTWAIVKELFLEVKGHLVEARRALQATVAAMKAASESVPTAEESPVTDES